MMYDKHYDEMTPYILVDGITPFANSIATHNVHIAEGSNRRCKKKLKQISKNYNGEYHMNIIFEKNQSFSEGDILTWKLHDEVMKLCVIDNGKLFVKGKHYYSFCCLIIEE